MARKEDKMKLNKVQKQQVKYLEGVDGVSVNIYRDGIEIETYTDAGGDMVDYFHESDCKEMKRLMTEYYDEYDINHEVAIWWPNGEKGTGVPFNDMSEHIADLKDWRKRMMKIIEQMPNDDGTIPEPKTEAVHIHLTITADEGCLADFLKDLAAHIRREGEDFHQYETCIGCAETTD